MNYNFGHFPTNLWLSDRYFTVSLPLSLFVSQFCFYCYYVLLLLLPLPNAKKSDQIRANLAEVKWGKTRRRNGIGTKMTHAPRCKWGSAIAELVLVRRLIRRKSVKFHRKPSAVQVWDAFRGFIANSMVRVRAAAFHETKYRRRKKKTIYKAADFP